MKLLSMFSQKKSKKGFTLVELVIVIAVLAIIAAIAIPTVNGVVANANKATDDSNCQAIAMTLKTYQAQVEAHTTHKLTGKPAALITTSTVKDLLEAYGTAFPSVKSNKTDVFVWDTANQSVTIEAAPATGGTKVKLADNNGKANWAKLSDLSIGAPTSALT